MLVFEMSRYGHLALGDLRILSPPSSSEAFRAFLLLPHRNVTGGCSQK